MIRSTSLAAVALAVALAGCDSTPTDPPLPTSISITAGDQQSGPVAAALSQPLVVHVTDSRGDPVAGVAVTWAAEQGAGSVSPGTATTDAAGSASAMWTLGTQAGQVHVSAVVAGVGVQTFTAQVLPGPAAAVTITPDSISLPMPADSVRLVAHATDQYQNPITNPAVQWSTSAPGVATVDASGLVRRVGTGVVLITAAVGSITDQASVVFPGPFAAITAGYTHACAVLYDQRVFCWGANDTGNLGTGTTAPSSRPVAVSGGLRFRALATGMQFTCGIATTGPTYCWGANGSGSLGNGTTTDSHVPVATAGGLALTQITAGPGAGSVHACALTAAGAAYCWGDNFSGQVGDATTETRLVPVPVAGGLVFAKISAGDNHTCAVTAAGAAYCWGSNASGQLGLADAGSACGFGVDLWNCSATPIPVSGGLAFASISAGGSFTCGVTTSGATYCWGEGTSGNLGNGGNASSAVPVHLSGPESFSQVAAGYPSHACGLAVGGSARCWGTNLTGELGTGLTAASTIPVAVAGSLRFTELVTGGQFSCGLTHLLQAYCWGGNDSGSLGNGTTTQSLSPVAVIEP
jgi:alpha-tubulin suppressor-like RCC1 family protein